MGTPIRRSANQNAWNTQRTNETMRLIITTFVGIIFGFFLGVSFTILSLTKVNLSSNIFPSFDLTYIEDKYSGLSTQALLNVWSALKGRRGSHKFNNTKE